MLVSGALFLLDWRIALLAIALLTTPRYVPKLIEKRLQRAQAAYFQAVEEALSGVTDWLHGFELIKDFAIEDKILDRFRRGLLCGRRDDRPAVLSDHPAG